MSIHIAESEGGIVKYWKNEKEIPLSDGKHTTHVTAMFVSGSDVYIAGIENTGKENMAVYWKNGEKVTLTDGSKEAHGQSIFVSGSDVYIAATEGGIAKYWKNGKEIPLSDEYSSACSIVVIP